MLPTTIDAVRSMLKADPSVPPAERSRILTAMRNCGQARPPPAESQDRLLRRREAAKLLGTSVRFIDKLAAEGVLPKVRMPNRKRALGIPKRAVEELIGARGG